MLDKYKMFGIIATIIIVASGEGLLAYYTFFLTSNSANATQTNPSINEKLKSMNSSEKNSNINTNNTTASISRERNTFLNYTLKVIGWTSCWGANPAIKNDEDVASLIVLMLMNRSAQVKKSLTMDNVNLSQMGIIIIPSFGWAYVGDANTPYPANPPFSESTFYNSVYQKVVVKYPYYLKVSPGKPFGVLLYYGHYKTSKKLPSQLDNMSFKISLQKVSKNEYKIWVSIYANGTYIGKVPVLLKVVPPSKANSKKEKEMKIYNQSYNVTLIKASSCQEYNPLTEECEVMESLIVLVLYNGTINASEVSYPLQKMGIGYTAGGSWIYFKCPHYLNSTFRSREYQKVIVYYPEKLKVSPGKPFGVILRYMHSGSNKGVLKPLENLTFKCSLQKVSNKEYKLWISIYVNGNYLGKVPVLLTLKP